jgi:hypothetical protein
MATLYDAHGTEIGRVSIHGTFGGARSSSGLPIDVGNPDRYVFHLEGGGSRVTEGDYRVDFNDGTTVQLQFYRASRADRGWLLTFDVKKPRSKA